MPPAWQSLITEWKKDQNLVPITGAGVSVNFGLCDRNALVERLSSVLKTEMQPADYKELIADKDMLLKIFRITYRLRQFACRGEKKDPVSTMIKTKLYETVPRSHMSDDAILWLECVYRLTEICRTFVTFNWDNVFEKYINDRYQEPYVVKSPLQAATDASATGPLSTKLPIQCFHLHGYMPDSKNVIELPLVFDLISYVEEYAGFINRLSATLLNVMANYHCIFLGLHMADANLLRLIRMAYELRGHGEQGIWGVALGTISYELSDTLKSWGVDVPEDFRNCRSSGQFAKIPEQVLESLGYESPRTSLVGAGIGWSFRSGCPHSDKMP